MKSAIAIMAAVCFTSCSEEKFHVNGTITNAKDSLLIFESMSITGPALADTVRLDESGTFEFSDKSPQSPEFYRLRIARQIINISVDSTETITINGEYPDMARNYKVEGSEECQRIKTLSVMQLDLQNAAYTMEKNKSLSNEAYRDSLMKLVEAYKNTVKENYIYANPKSASAYFALFQTIGNYLIFSPEGNKEDTKAFAAVATSWDTFYPEALRTKNLHNIALKGISTDRIISYESNKPTSQIEIVESNIIDITLPDNKGQQRSLTDMKGKVVMLDFHVFGMKESPERILLLRELHNKYHERGFEIFQISLDADEHFWKQQTENLPWISVRDKNGLSSSVLASYNIHSLPEYFLIDRNNSLVNRSQQIKDIEKAIEKLL